MDKYEFNIKVEQIKKLVGKSDYETAMKIADTIDWRRVRNTNLLSMVAMVYEKNEDYEEAREILLLAFERAPIGKRLLYKLAELALKEGNIDEAEAYYREFSDLAGDDPRQQLLRYLILKAKGAPAQQLIHSLESYTSQEIDEKWLYELAELYSIAGMADRCVETCDKIMLMFGLGKYVDKAMELKIQYAPLTTYQMDLVENRDKYEAKLRAVEQEYGLGGGQMNVPEQDEEYYDDGNPGMDMPEEPYYGDLQARMQEAEVQEGLAREMSRMSYEEPPAEQRPRRHDNTRVLDDIRRINRPVMRDSEYDGASMAAVETAAAGTAYAGGAFAGAADGMAGAAYGAADAVVHMAGNAERLASAMPRPRGMMRMPEMADEVPAEPVIEEDYTYGNSGYGESSYGDASYEDGSYGDASYDGQAYNGDTYGKPGYGENSYGEPAYGENAYGEAAYGENAYREPGYGGHAYGDASHGQSTYGETAYGENTYGDSAYGENNHEGAAYGDNSYGEAAYGENTSEESAYGGNLADDVAYGASDYDDPAYGETAYSDSADGELTGDDPVYGETVYDEPETSYDESEGDDSAYVQGDSEYSTPEDHRANVTVLNKRRTEDDVLEVEDLEDEEEEPPVLNHLMIEARTPEKGLKIAVEALKQIHNESGIKNPVAKITGEKLSKRGVLASASKLAGKDLVIEEAGDLTPEALEELYELMNHDNSGMIVVLIDNPKQMENLHRNHPRLASKFECIGSGEGYEPGEEYTQTISPAQEPRPAARNEEPVMGAAAPKAAVRPLYPERNDAPVRRQPAPPVQEVIPEPRRQPVYADEPYEENSYDQDIRDAQSYETDSYEEEVYDDFPDEEAAPKKKKGLFRNRKKPVYEEMEPEESYDENDDYYVEEDEDGEEAMSYRNDDGPGSHGEEMDIDEFAQYACRYANEIDCSITGKSMLALYERIEIMEEDGVALTRENAEGLIEEAADRAEKPSFGKRVKGIFSSKYDKDGLLILKEEHFIY
ncbi:tetratricopeptide repeat protein [Hungatella effluvii]|uniref:Tetratricopeptide repeat protein n=1 Tax=Hungatella effluvii TaxID=1096246 RepID=A0A2V3XTF6_9FIRM|nr:hypothetical protein [Hungatella effluvii]PXX42998.1 tetratricopeptide repeat protein [Hungatella effluvii]